MAPYHFIISIIKYNKNSMDEDVLPIYAYMYVCVRVRMRPIRSTFMFTDAELRRRILHSVSSSNGVRDKVTTDVRTKRTLE